MRALLLLAVSTLAVGPAAAQSFQGTIVTKMFSDGKPSGELVSSYLGDRTRVDMRGRGSEGAYMLMNGRTAVWTTVMPAQKMYMTMDLKSMANDEKPDGRKAGPAPKLTRTGKSETIAGYSCDHYTYVDEEGGTIDICAAKGLGFFGMMGGGQGPRGGQMPGMGAVPVEYRELVNTYKDGFQPLRIENLKGGKRELVMEVTSIEKKTLPASDFEVPAGYKAFDMGGMMKGKLPKLPIKPPR